MSLPIAQTPPQIRSLLGWYKKNFKRKQYKYFRNLITGLIVSDNMNRFLTKSEWDANLINDARIKQIKELCPLGKGILICGPTLLQLCFC